ncbi:MAG TPA: hypothetical protein VJG30_00925 [Candidatus Nanoarchaeia archaeon]|nr:hypothetical protein [Candidatus Nanoarchaeia archaeon]
MNKRGQAEQFNWIFVIVAGAIILGFFTMFVFQYIDLQEKRQEVESVRFFGNVLNVLEKLQIGDAGYAVRSTDTQGLRFGYKVDLSYYCKGNDAKILINKGEIASYNLANEIVFTEEKQRVNGLTMGIMPWIYPFHITNFIYLSDPNKIYHIIYDESSEEFVNRLEEENEVIFNAIKYEKTRINELKPKQNSKIIIFSSQKPYETKIKELKGSGNSNFVHVNINTEKISFFGRNGWEDEIKYYGNPMLLGSLFMDNTEAYECNVNRAFERLKTVTNIYIERTELLKRIDPKQECQYELIVSSLRKFSEGDYKMAENLAEQNNQGAGCLWVF